MDAIINTTSEWMKSVFDWSTSPAFYSQAGLILLAIVAVYLLSSWLRVKTSEMTPRKVSRAPLSGDPLRKLVQNINDLLFPFLLVVTLTILADAADTIFGDSHLMRLALSLSLVFVIYSIINRFIKKKLYRKVTLAFILPIALLKVFGVLDEVTDYLEGLSIEAGNIKITAYGIIRVIIFGSVLFWLGRLFNSTVVRLIRNQDDLDIGTKEVFAKLFQVALATVFILLMFQIMGINLTALAVFGGALGVGLGFGLQSIAANFISGIILLLDRTLTVGDYVEMEDGKSGTIRELNMRSATLETFDGKDIVIPNERFITTEFTNWTHKNIKQRYSLEFQVAYSTNIHDLLPMIRDTVNSHPQVLSGNDLPIAEMADAEIQGFGESGIDILVEFWMEGIDDGDNHVGADLMLMIWTVLKEHNIEIPFPQREISVRHVQKSPS